MKKLTLLLLFISSFAYSQVIGEIRLMGKLNIGLVQDFEDCNFTYIDEKFVQITSYKSFTFPADELETIYNLFSAKEPKNTKVKYDLPNGILSIIYKNTHIEVYHTNTAGVTGIFTINQRQINKVFNKDGKK